MKYIVKINEKIFHLSKKDYEKFLLYKNPKYKLEPKQK